MHGPSPAAELARSPAAWERLAKEWLVEVIERTPLDDIQELPLEWMSSEASPLIAEILGQLSDPGAARELRLTPAAQRRAQALAAALGESGAERLPRELAALQALLVEALGREIPERDRGEFARAAVRLAEVFGAVQSAAVESLVRERTGAAGREAEARLPGTAELREWVGMLLAEHRRDGQPFALAHLEVEGVERIQKGYGEDAAARIVGALAAVVGAQLAGRERAFRMGPGQLVALAPEREARDLVDLGTRIANVVEAAQVETGPRVTINVGLASCPAHGESEAELLGAAEQAAWAARAKGELMAIAGEDAARR